MEVAEVGTVAVADVRTTLTVVVHVVILDAAIVWISRLKLGLSGVNLRSEVLISSGESCLAQSQKLKRGGSQLSEAIASFLQVYREFYALLSRTFTAVG